MAVMNPYQQRLLMQQLARRDPTALARLAGAQGGGLAGLVGGPQGGDMSLLGLVEPAQMVTPGSPAPMQPGRDVVAPPPPQQQQPGQVAPVGPGYRKDGAVDQAVNTPEAILGAARMHAAQMSDEAARAAVVPAEVEAVLGKREKRYAEQLAEVEEDKKKAGWEALAMAGFRMAQSQSPYFMSALATGMEAGLNGFNASKAARAEKKARLQTAEEDVVLAREAAKQKARADAEARQAREIGLAGTLLGQQEAGGKIAEFEQFAPFRKKAAELSPQSIQADIDYKTEQAREAKARAGYYDRSPGAGLGGSEGQTGQTGLKTGQIISMINNATTRKTRLQAAVAATISREERTKLMAEIMAIDEEIRDLRQRAGLDSGAGASSGAGARDPLGIRQPRG